MTTTPAKPNHERLLTRDQVVERLNCSVTYLRQTIEPTGALTPVRLGRRVRFREHDVDRFIRRLGAAGQFNPRDLSEAS